MCPFDFSSGTSVWKVRIATLRWDPGTEGCGFICRCDGVTVRWHKEQPLLFDMTNNPREDQPMDFTDPRYKEYVARAGVALKRHMEHIYRDTPDQISFWNFIWKPQLQPCCNFPYCSCTDAKYPN